MITIYHGEDNATSRADFIAQRSKLGNVVSLSGTNLTHTDILQNLAGNELFATEKYIFIEDFFAKKKPSKESDAIIEEINKSQQDATIFLWESKDLTSAQLKKFPKALIKQYKYPQTLFVFLDAIRPNNATVLLLQFHAATEHQDVIFLFAMLIRQFRLMLALKEPGTSPIEEIKRMSPWQKSKLEKQTRMFDLSSLTKHYQELYRLEYASKTGGLSMPLEHAIDFFLLHL